MMRARPLGVLLFATALVASSACGPGTAPAGQPPMAAMTRDSLGSFREAFNQASEQTRIVLLLSPT